MTFYLPLLSRLMAFLPLTSRKTEVTPKSIHTPMHQDEERRIGRIVNGPFDQETLPCIHSSQQKAREREGIETLCQTQIRGIDRDQILYRSDKAGVMVHALRIQARHPLPVIVRSWKREEGKEKVTLEEEASHVSPSPPAHQ